MHDAREIVKKRLSDIGVDPDSVPSLVDELAQHVEDRYRVSRAIGLDDAAARDAAVRELDGCERFATEYRTTASPPSPPPASGPRAGALAALRQDVGYALRMLGRSPGFTAIAILTVALSTGPTMLVMGVANWMFFRPVPGVHEPHQLGVAWFGTWPTTGGFSPSFISYANAADIEAKTATVVQLAGHASSSVNLAVSGTNEVPRIATAQFVSANFFDVLGVSMAEGRGFAADEDRDPGASSVVVLGGELARIFFAGESALGRSLRINGHRFTVIGVARPRFEGHQTGEPVGLWLPGLSYRRVNHSPPERWAYDTDRGPFFEYVFRLRRGATFAQAEAELQAATRGLPAPDSAAAARFATLGPRVFGGLGLHPQVRDPMRRVARMFAILSLVLVLVGVANLANLFLFRAARRGHEAAIRGALGASSLRLVQPYVVEGLLVSGGGALAGLLIAMGARWFLERLPIPGIGRPDLTLDWRLFAAACGVGAIVGVLLSAAPARIVVRGAVQWALGAGNRSGTRPGTKLRTGLAIVQVALSLALLVGGLLFVETLRQIRAVDLGIDLRGVSTFSFALRGQAYTADRTRLFYRQLIDALRDVGGVDTVSATTIPPLAGARHGIRMLPPDIAQQTGLSRQEQFEAAVRVLSTNVTADYFTTFGMRTIAGRTFTEAEAFSTDLAAPVVIGASLAKRYFGGAAAVGRTLTIPAQGNHDRFEAPIIGIVNDVRWIDPRQPVADVIYQSFQVEVPGAFLMVRSGRPAGDLRAAVQATAAKIDPQLPLASDLTMLDLISRQLVLQRLFAWLLGVLSALGVALSGIGIYGLVSQVVLDRVREFGIRLAIGAQPRQIVTLVIRQALVIAALGVPAGVLFAGLLSRAVNAQLFGVSPLAPALYAAASAAVIAAVSLATVGPARRALQVDPVDVMRAE